MKTCVQCSELIEAGKKCRNHDPKRWPFEQCVPASQPFLNVIKQTRVAQGTDSPHMCMPGDPWTKEKGKRGFHPFATEVGEQQDGWPSGDLQDWKCPVCEHEWTEELPQ